MGAIKDLDLEVLGLDELKNITPFYHIKVWKGTRKLASWKSENEGLFYDLASLTKVLLTLPLYLDLVEKKEITLRDPIVKYLSWFPNEEVRIYDLLTHSSGLPNWILLSSLDKKIKTKSLQEKSKILSSWFREQKYKIDSQPVYSDCGYWLLGLVLESIYNKPFYHLAKDWLYHKYHRAGTEIAIHDPDVAKLRTLGGKLLKKKEHIVAMHDGRRRSYKPQEVNDTNAMLLGGLAPHSGLFATQKGFSALTKMWLDVESDFGFPSDLKKKVTRSQLPGWCTGFERPSAEGSLLGDDWLPADAFGHWAFTGCSLWKHKKEDLAVGIMMSCSYEKRQRALLSQFRKKFHTEVLKGVQK